MKSTKKKKLSTKLMIGMLLFALFIMICTSAAVGIYSSSVEINEITANAFALSRSGARMIDGDQVRKYLNVVGTKENGDKLYYSDQYYNEVITFLNAIQDENDFVLYYYVCVPVDEGLLYIWDATTSEHPLPQGHIENIQPKERKAAELAFSRTPEEKYVRVSDKTWGNLLTAYSPIFDSSGEPVALVGTDLSINKMVMKFTNYLGLIFISILVVTGIGVLLLFKVMRRVVIDPIEKLNNAFGSEVGSLRSKTRFDPEIHTGDELEELANSFRKMDNDLHDYIGQLTAVTADRERISAELGLAKRIQAKILPNDYPAFPERNDFDIYALLSPSEQIGGDFYDFFLIDDDHLAMVVGSVSAQGIPAALNMVILETLIKSRAMQSFTPADVLQSVSEQMISYKTGLSSAVWLAVLELSSGKGIAINAGYESPLLHRAGKQFEQLEYEGFPEVGAAESSRYRDHGFQLCPGDSVFIFSDGIRNARNKKGERFGDRRVLELLNHEPEATPSVLIQTVKQAVDRFSADEPQPDDCTMLSLKYYGANESKRTELIRSVFDDED
jgi:sigma-B regulation protein RsbU (phosphoserine phosphatase)